MRKSEEFKKAISKDLQNEFVKKVLRIHPGVIWLGTYTTYGVELFSYSRKVIGVDGKSIQLMPTNMEKFYMLLLCLCPKELFTWQKDTQIWIQQIQKLQKLLLSQDQYYNLVM